MYVLVQYIMYTCSRISISLLTLMNHQKELHNNVRKFIKGIANWSSAAWSVVQGPKKGLGQQFQ